MPCVKKKQRATFPNAGFEPATTRLKAERSTAELTGLRNRPIAGKLTCIWHDKLRNGHRLGWLSGTLSRAWTTPSASRQGTACSARSR
jgi:hypothetical protein